MQSVDSAPVRRAPDWLVLTIACVAQFMVVLDVSIVNVALPSMRRDLHYSVTGLQWVVNAYVLTFAGFLLLGGRAADLFGRRRIYLVGLVWFTVASLVGGLSTSSTMLTTARAAQGLGGAVLSPVTLTIIMTTFPEGRPRQRAVGMWSAVAGAGGAAGAILGGVLTSYLSWRWVLFVNVPIGALGSLLAFAYLSEARRPTRAGKLDVAGALTVTAGLAVLVYAIVGTDVHPWSSSETIGLLGAAAFLIAAFVLIEMRASAPLVPLRLFSSRALSAANVVMLLVGTVFFSSWYFLSLYYQGVLGYSPLRAGLAFLPMAIAIIISAQIGSRLVGRFGPRPLLVIGIVLAGAGYLWLSQLHADSSFLGGVLVASVLVAGGVGFAFPALATAATAGVAFQEAGLASGVLQTSRQVGGSIGLAVLATLASDRSAAVARRAHVVAGQALTSGYDRAFLVGAGLSVLAALAALWVPVQRRTAAQTQRSAVHAVAE